MARKRTIWAIASLAAVFVSVAVWFTWTPPGTNAKLGLPGTVLSDAQMHNVVAGRDIIIEFD